MKKFFTILLVLMGLPLWGQTGLTAEKTDELLRNTNNLYCETLDNIIRCMFEYDEQKFTTALENLKLVLDSYELLDTQGSFTSALKRQSVSTFKWSTLSLFFDKELYASGERDKKVTYAGIDRKIPKKLKEQFDKLREISDEVCIANMY
jgi:hypothetical protein